MRFLILTFFLLSLNSIYANEQLRQKALSKGLLPIYDGYDYIKKQFDTPSNPITMQKINLGKRLFNDKNLSLSKKISCASCHDIKNGGADNKPTAIGHNNLENPSHLNTPTVLNSAFAKSFFWNGSSPTLAHQAKGPTLAPFEMASSAKLIETRVKQNKDYVKQFNLIYENNSSITFDNITKIIATYEKTLLTKGSFDEFLKGDDSAISKDAKEGLELFINLGCKGCHNGQAVGGKLLAKFPLRTYNGLFYPTFIYDKRRKLDAIKLQFSQSSTKYPFENKGGFLGKGSTQVFRVPILRNITKTAPYFHNGMVKSLDKTIYIMAKYQLGIDLNKNQISKIEEFLKTLEGELINY